VRPQGGASLAGVKARAAHAEGDHDDTTLAVDYQEAYAVQVDEAHLSQLPGLEILRVRCPHA